jgi:hypothetical protein
MYVLPREIPYRSTSETFATEKKINDYIKKNPLILEIPVGEKMFEVFLKAIPKDKREHYRKVGIPYGTDGFYTLRVK